MIVKCGKDIYLREIYPDDYERILEIVRACAAHCTRELYRSYLQNDKFKNNMNNVFEKDFLSKLAGNFKHFDNMMAKEGTTLGSPHFKEFMDKLEDALKYFPDDQLFSLYGPIQPPFDESVREFINAAIDAKAKKERKMYRMGVAVGDSLIGCLTIDFNKNKTPGYPKETTGDPGIFLDPGCRENNGIRRWREVLSLAAKIVEEYYPFKENEIPISATTHRFNAETKNFLSPDNGFAEFPDILHGKYGERRFFTVDQKVFIDKFDLSKEDPGYKAVIT